MNKATSHVPTRDPKPCPNCGHCPTCGRGSQPSQYPYFVPFPYYPWYGSPWNGQAYGPTKTWSLSDATAGTTTFSMTAGS